MDNGIQLSIPSISHVIDFFSIYSETCYDNEEDRYNTFRKLRKNNYQKKFSIKKLISINLKLEALSFSLKL